jgi:serine phosphatase RsbU (regulator of sigma subunit)
VAERTIELIIKQKKIEEEKDLMSEWRKEMDFELNVARGIQQQIIPDNNPENFISAMFKPMAPIGGDFYDFIRFRESDTTGIFISDVSGHGIPAALITTMIKSIISGAGGIKLNPAQMLMNLNETLVKQSGDNFVTAFYGIYNRTNRTILYSCAGHNPPYMIHNSKITVLDKARSLPLGIYTSDELKGFDKAYINQCEKLPPESKLLLYTDGLTEARAEGRDEYYFESIMGKILPGMTRLSCRDFITDLYKELVNFRGSENFEDDVCIICVDIE